MDRRVFLIVLDSFGIGEEPDAADFGDVGSLDGYISCTFDIIMEIRQHVS